MPYIPYISVDEFRAYSGGVKIPLQLDDIGLNELLIQASVKVDGYCQTTFQYQTITNEIHNFVDREAGFQVGWDIFPYYRPIRTVNNFFVATGQGPDAGWVGLNATIAPTYPVGDSAPVGFGTLIVDRNRGFIQNTSSLLSFGIGVLRLLPQSVQPISVMLNYTAGYDTGLETDGTSFPVPELLKQATRAVAYYLLLDYNIFQDGMGGYQSAKVGDVHVTRFRPISKTKQLSYQSFPDEAKDILLPFKLKSARYVGA